MFEAETTLNLGCDDRDHTENDLYINVQFYYSFEPRLSRAQCRLKDGVPDMQEKGAEEEDGLGV